MAAFTAVELKDNWTVKQKGAEEEWLSCSIPTKSVALSIFVVLAQC